MVAITADKVVVELEAKLDRYNANVQRSERNFNRAMASMGASARRTEQSVIGSVRGIVGAYLGIQGARLAVELVDANTRIMNSLRVAGLEGEEVTRVYNELFASAQRNAVPIESLAQLFGRVATVQKELGATTEELIQFTDNVALALRVAGTNAQSASGAILQLSQAMGSGVVRAEEFNSILEGALPIAQAAAAGLEEAGGSVAKLRKLVIDGKVSSEAFFRALEAGSVILRQRVANATLTVAQGFTLLQNAFIDAAGKVNEGTDAGRRFADVLSQVAQVVRTTDFGPLIDEITQFITDIRQAAQDAALFFEIMQRKGSFSDLGRDLADAFGALGFGRDSSGDPFGISEGLDATIARVKANDKLRTAMSESISKGIEDGATTGVSRIDQAFAAAKPKTVSLADFDAPDGDKKKKENAYAREIRHFQERKALMEAELITIGQTQFMRDKSLAAQELENARLQAKIPLNDTIRNQIEQEAEAFAHLAEQVRNAEDRQQAINDLLQTFGDIAADTFIGLIDGTKSWNDALQDVLKTLAKMFAQAAFTGGGPLGSLLGLSGDNGSVGGLFGLFKRAGGGSARQGQAHMVGEQGPELFIPGQSGRVVPNHRLSTATSPAPTNGGVVMNNDFRGVVASERAYIDSRISQLERQIAMTPQATSEVWKTQRPALRVGA